MKKLLSLALLAIIFIACNQDRFPDNPTEKTYPVKFTTKLNFSPEDTQLRKALLNDSTHIPNDSTHIPNDSTHIPGDTTHIPSDSIFYRYFVYKSPSGTFFKQNSGVGYEINDNLPLGSYYIAILASTYGDLLDRNNNVPAGHYFMDTINYPRAFYQTFEVTTSENNGQYNQTGGTNISLERMWGEIYVDILDKATCYFPANVRSVNFRVEGKSPSFMVESKNPNYHNGAITNTPLSVSTFRQLPSVKCLTSFSTNENQVNIYIDIIFTDNTPTKSVLLASTKVKKGIKTTLKGNLGNIFETQNGDDLRLQLQLDENWIDQIVTF